MTGIVEVKLPATIVERLRREARKADLSLEEYIVELVLQNLDPSERAREYLEASKNLLQQAREELEKGNIRQAAEKLWGSAALAVKAHAQQKENKRLTSHRELWEYTKKLIDELGDIAYDAWMAANGMHTCFYEGWCTTRHIEEALKRIEKLVREIKERIEKKAT